MPITINGNGSITGISTGGLPNDCVTNADLEYAGTSGQVLTSQGSSAAPQWATASGASWNTGTAISPSGVNTLAFDNIPSNAKVIYITLFGISWTSASGYLALQLKTGPSTTITSGYLTTSTYLAHAAAVNIGNNSHALQCNIIQSAGANINATVRIINVTGNTWNMDAVFTDENSGHMIVASGHIPLSSALTGVNIYQTGANNFDDGTVQIHYITG